jgi:hypothetical protein
MGSNGLPASSSAARDSLEAPDLSQLEKTNPKKFAQQVPVFQWKLCQRWLATQIANGRLQFVPDTCPGGKLIVSWPARPSSRPIDIWCQIGVKVRRLGRLCRLLTTVPLITYAFTVPSHGAGC